MRAQGRNLDSNVDMADTVGPVRVTGAVSKGGAGLSGPSVRVVRAVAPAAPGSASGRAPGVAGAAAGAVRAAGRSAVTYARRSWPFSRTGPCTATR